MMFLLYFKRKSKFLLTAFLHCPQFGLQHMDVFRQLAEVPDFEFTDIDSALCDLLLYGNADLNISTNRMIIEATISCIEKTRRFG